MTSVSFRSVLMTTEHRTDSVQSCSVCTAVSHYACIDHCGATFCTRCTNTHHFIIIAQMRDIFELLKTYRANPSSFFDASEQVGDTTTSSETINIQFLETYLDLLNDHLKKDRLLDAKTLADLSRRLETRTPRSQTNAKRHPVPHSPRKSQSAKPKFSKSVTVALNDKRCLPLAIQTTFSVGQHPVVVSLIDHYEKTFFCEWRENSVILLSALSLDVYSRSAGLAWSIPLIRILGNIKDRILTGVWSSYLERLILVGQTHFYVYDIDDQKVRCICHCGCGGRCGNGPMRPKRPRSMTLRYRCPVGYNNHSTSGRFAACSYTGRLFYGYKSDKNTYKLVVYDLSPSAESKNVGDESEAPVEHGEIYDSRALLREREFRQMDHSVSFEGQLAAIHVTHDRVAVVYRQLKSQTKPRNAFDTDHYFALFDHNLIRVVKDASLPSSIRWLTAVVPHGIKSDYLLCDPAGQQLLTYNAIDGTMFRHFHIAPINACCLTDGRLVLWIEKAYSSSPIGKLHFISAPHLENSSSVASSMNLLKTSRN